jgi:alpha-glucoside transport system permease protein
MATTTEPELSADLPEVEPPSEPHAGLARNLIRTGIVVAVLVASFFAAQWLIELLSDQRANRWSVVGVALLVGVVGVFLAYWAMDTAVDWLPVDWRETVRPYVFIGPAVFLLLIFLVYPVINTLILSLRNARNTDWVGLENFEFVFTDDSMLRSIRNSAGWIVVVPLVAVTIGLLFATLADRLKRGEAAAKSLIFLPMAISFVGAAVVWQFVYNYRPEGFGSNIGLLNAVWGLFGNEPVSWLAQKPWNNFLLMMIMVWMQVGFAMVVLSAAIKSVPDEIKEAARIDGASELQVFGKIVVPSILPTIVVVTTYMVINALKVFDIVFVMGSPQANETEVIAERMIHWYFLGSHSGRGAAIAVVLFIAVIPVMIWNVRQFREQEATR